MLLRWIFKSGKCNKNGKLWYIMYSNSFTEHMFSMRKTLNILICMTPHNTLQTYWNRRKHWCTGQRVYVLVLPSITFFTTLRYSLHAYIYHDSLFIFLFFVSPLFCCVALPVKGCNVWPSMLGTRDHWAVTVRLRATPTVTRGIRLK